MTEIPGRMVSDEEHDFYELPANQAPLGPGRRRRRNRWADGLWNGRPIEEWIPEVVADVVKPGSTDSMG